MPRSKPEAHRAEVMRGAGRPSAGTIPCFPSVFLFIYLFILFFLQEKEKTSMTATAQKRKGTEDAHSVLCQGLSSRTATHTSAMNAWTHIDTHKCPSMASSSAEGSSRSRASPLLERLSEGGKESLHEEEQDKLWERKGETGGEMPGDTQPQRIPNRLAANLQTQHSHLVEARSTLRRTETNRGRQRKGDG